MSPSPSFPAGHFPGVGILTRFPQRISCSSWDSWNQRPLQRPLRGLALVMPFAYREVLSGGCVRCWICVSLSSGWGVFPVVAAPALFYVPSSLWEQARGQELSEVFSHIYPALFSVMSSSPGRELSRSWGHISCCTWPCVIS